MEPETIIPPPGSVAAIHLARATGAPMESVDVVEAVAGRGLRGDRYFARQNVSSSTPAPGREVTLIEMEAIERATEEAGIEFQSSESRRNIVTRGVSLNELIDREFRVG